VGARWIHGEADDVIVVDDTHFPLVVATWIGAPTPPAVRDYFAWLNAILERAQREGTSFVNVGDGRLAGVPSAAVRALIADLSKEWYARHAGKQLKAVVVVDNPLIRGVLRALAWLAGDLDTEQIATCEEALTFAVRLLERSGVKPPRGLVPSAWQPPGRSSRATEEPPRRSNRG
jgi:hypothetical protein